MGGGRDGDGVVGGVVEADVDGGAAPDGAVEGVGVVGVVVGAGCGCCCGEGVRGGGEGGRVCSWGTWGGDGHGVKPFNGRMIQLLSL